MAYNVCGLGGFIEIFLRRRVCGNVGEGGCCDNLDCVVVGEGCACLEEWCV